MLKAWCKKRCIIIYIFLHILICFLRRFAEISPPDSRIHLGISDVILTEDSWYLSLNDGCSLHFSRNIQGCVTSRRLTNLQLGDYCLPIRFSIARTERENTADCTTSAPAIGSDVGVMYEPPIRALPRFITARYRGVGNCKRIALGRRMECPEINRRVIFSRLNESLPTCRYSEDEINDI